MTLTRYITMLYGNFWDPPLQNMIATLCCGHHFRALSPFYSLKIALKKKIKYWISHYLFSCHFVTVFFEQPPHPGGKLTNLWPHLAGYKYLFGDGACTVQVCVDRFRTWNDYKLSCNQWCIWASSCLKLTLLIIMNFYLVGLVCMIL
jgi:hypothetical protein